MKNNLSAAYYPINLALGDKKCVVIGAGRVAERKARRLLEYGANVFVIGPDAAPGLKGLAKKKKIILRNRRFNLKDLGGACLAIAAAADRRLNSLVSSYCRRKGILVNVVDAPGECDFILPSIIRRGRLTISISTDGISPALAKKIRQDFGQRLGSEYVKFLGIMKEIRPQALKRLKNLKARKQFFQKALELEVFSLLKQIRKNKQKEGWKIFWKMPSYLKFHILTIYLSYIIFIAASGAAVLYLIENNALKTKQIGAIFSRMPNLAFLDKLNYRSIGLGFPILTISILSGFIWAKNIHGVYWLNSNPRQIYSLVLWLTYAVILHIRLSAKVRGRKVALLSLFAFFVIILSLFGACP